MTFKAKPAKAKKGAVLASRQRHAHASLVGKDEKKPATKEEKTNEEPSCLVRATDGKVKFSTTVRFVMEVSRSELPTQVKAKDTVRFHLALTTIMKAHMDSLKKREKSKRPKTKNTATSV